MRYLVSVGLLALAGSLAGCHWMDSEQSDAAPQPMIAGGYYPQQAPFYAGASAPVVATYRAPMLEPAKTRRMAVGCQRRPHYHRLHEAPAYGYGMAQRTAVYGGAAPASYPVLFTFPTATRGYDWGYWRHPASQPGY